MDNQFSTPKKTSLVSAKAVSAHIGEKHDANPMFRPTMEDDTCIHMFEDFPGLFLGVYDGHGGSMVASLLRQLLHRYFLDELLMEHVMEHVDDSDSNSDSLPSPYELADTNIDPTYSEQSSPSTITFDCDTYVKTRQHPLNTRALDAIGAFTRAYQKTDAALRARRCMRVGATAVTCFVREVKGQGKILTTANCGDCRAVLSRGGQPLRLTQDHRPCDKEERLRVEQAGGFVACGRVNGILNVSRAFGDHSMSCVVSTPFVNEIVLTDMDDFVVLACDGLWDFVDDKAVITVAQDGFDRGMNAEDVAGLLVKTALDHKGTDNVSVMVVQFGMDEE